MELGKQHKETSEPRQLIYCKDTQIVIDFVEKLSPFNGNLQLRNMINGLTAHKSVNIDSARALGIKIIDSMSRELVADFLFRRNQQAVQITKKQNPGRDCKRMCPTLLLQKLVTPAKSINFTESEYFQHELCSYPASLFDSFYMLRSPNKPEFAEAIAQPCNLEECSTLPLHKSIRYHHRQ